MDLPHYKTDSLQDSAMRSNLGQELPQWHNQNHEQISTTSGNADLRRAHTTIFEDMNGIPAVTRVLNGPAADYVAFDDSMDGMDAETTSVSILGPESIQTHSLPMRPLGLLPSIATSKKKGKKKGKKNQSGKLERGPPMVRSLLDAEMTRERGVVTTAPEWIRTREPNYWHQSDPSSLVGTEELWQPPEDDGSEPTEHKGTSPWFYVKAARKIEKEWHCSVVDAMPLHFRASTPYSLAMIGLLYNLAFQYPDDMVGAHAALDRQRRVRLPGMVPQSGDAHIVWTQTMEKADTKRDILSEHYVWENQTGLMLIDVAKAWSEKQQEKWTARETAKEENNKRKLLEASNIDAVVERTRNRKEKKKQKKKQDRLQVSDVQLAAIVHEDPKIYSANQRIRYRREAKTAAMDIINSELLDRAGCSSEVVGPGPPPITRSSDIANEIENAGDLEPSKRAKCQRTTLCRELSKTVTLLITSEQQDRKGKKRAVRSANKMRALPSERLLQLRPLQMGTNNVPPSSVAQSEQELLPEGGVAIDLKDQSLCEK